MPIYEYTCKSCKKSFELLVRSMRGASDDKAKCPECGSTQTARALSVFAVSSEASRDGTSVDPSCGRCGGAPGSCGMG